jgi:hypothetical protein
MANFINIKDIILNDYRNINTEQIVSIRENGYVFELRMSNGDCYTISADKYKELIQRIINDKEASGYANIQLSSKRTTKRTNRDIQ